MATYAYHFYDIASGDHIDTLPVQAPRFGREIGGVGTFSGTLPLYADDLSAARVHDAVLPYRTKIYVERDGQLVWGGWIHEEPGYDSATGVVTVSAEETLGYFERRFLPTVSYSADQLDIARDLLAAAQAVPGGDVRLVAVSSV